MPRPRRHVAGVLAPLLAVGWVAAVAAPSVATAVAGPVPFVLAAAGPRGLQLDVSDGLAVRRFVLGDPSGDTGTWTGQWCASADGGTIGAIAYPAEAVGHRPLGTLGRAFVIDVRTGAASSVPGAFNASYHNPGCGPSGTIAFSARTEAGPTTVTIVSTTDRSSTLVTIEGQATSVVPTSGSEVVAAKGSGVVRVDAAGTEHTVATTDGRPFRLAVDGSGAVDFSVDGPDGVTDGPGGGPPNPVPGALDGSTSAPTPAGAATSAVPTPTVVEVAASATSPTAALGTTTPVCAIERNNPALMARQPNPAQVAWATQQAVLGNSSFTRPTGFLPGFSSYRPFAEFPPVALAGGGRIPLPIADAVLAQESNWLQASRRALPGVSANPLVSNYFGAPYDNPLGVIDYAKADCGYGVAQVTTGMRLGDPVYTRSQQVHIALDYAANIAAGLQILGQKWNQLAAHGVIANEGVAAHLESWYFAVWAYNTGYHEAGEPDAAGYEGLGWSNNPANPDYPPDRAPFLSVTYDDARHPAHWPYQERIAGWATHALAPNGVPYYLPAVGHVALPNPNQLCTGANDCDPGSADRCQLTTGAAAWHCWWRWPVAWADCPAECATVLAGPVPSNTEPPGSDNYPPNCSTLPPVIPGFVTGRTSFVVEEVKGGTSNMEGCRPVPNGTVDGAQFGGSFQASFAIDSRGLKLGQIDYHQLGSGFGGHTYFTDVQTDPRLRITGRWTPPALSGPYTVWAHIPPTGATASRARYTLFDGVTKTSVLVDQSRFKYARNSWVSIGTRSFTGGGWIELNNERLGITEDGVDTIAFDAMAFTPVPDTPHVTVIGDSYGSSEGIAPYSPESDTAEPENRCHRSLSGFAPKLRLNQVGAGKTVSYACSGAHTDNLTSVAQYATQPIQLNAISPSTTKVVISIGGNDLGGEGGGLASVITTCILETAHPFDSCHAGTAMDDLIQRRTAALYADLQYVVGQVKKRAPRAQVLIVGYPRMFAGNAIGQALYTTKTAFSMASQRWLNQVADQLATTLALAADASGASFLDLRRPFETHDVSAYYDPIPNNWVNGVVPGHSNCSPVAECGSFHPNQAGADAYAARIQPWIDQGILPPRGDLRCPTSLLLPNCATRTW